MKFIIVALAFVSAVLGKTCRANKLTVFLNFVYTF